MPLESDVRDRAKSLLDSVFGKVTQAVVAAILLLLVPLGLSTPRILAAIALGLSALWISTTVMLRSSYVDLFRRALSKGTVELPLGADELDLSSVEAVLEALSSRDPVRVIAAISEELFDRQPQAYRDAVLPPEARYDLMVVSTGTRRVWPLHDVGPLTDEYSMTSDWDDQWLTGGLEPDVIAEAHLDAASILTGITRFARERDDRMGRQRDLLTKLI